MAILTIHPTHPHPSQPQQKEAEKEEKAKQRRLLERKREKEATDKAVKDAELEKQRIARGGAESEVKSVSKVKVSDLKLASVYSRAT